jgi:hypothetical protein
MTGILPGLAGVYKYGISRVIPDPVVDGVYPRPESQLLACGIAMGGPCAYSSDQFDGWRAARVEESNLFGSYWLQTGGHCPTSSPW